MKCKQKDDIIIVSSSSNRTFDKIYVCTTCNGRGFILRADETGYTEKTFIEECPECNS